MQSTDLIESDFEQVLEALSLQDTRTVKKPNRTAHILTTIMDWTIYALVFLTPLFFLPLLNEPRELSKQALFLVSVTVISLLYFAKILVTGRIKVKFGLPIIAVGGVFVAWLLATIFSLYPTASLWGINGLEYESLLTILLVIGLVKILASHLTGKKIEYILIALLTSSVFTSVFAILQLFNVFILPWELTKTNAFTTVGPLLTLGGFTVIALLVAINNLVTTSFSVLHNTLTKKIVLAAITILHLSLLVLINNWALWLSLAMGLIVLVGIFFTQRSQEKKMTWIVLPSLLLALSLFATFFNTPHLIQLPTQTDPSLKTTWSITYDAVKRYPLFGTGPSNFVLSYEAFRPKDINNQDVLDLWKVRFEHGGSAILGKVSGTGLAGLLALLTLAAITIRQLFIYLKSSSLNEQYLQTIGLSSALAGAFAVTLLLPGNMTLIITEWVLLGCIFSVITKNSLAISYATRNRFLIATTLAGTVLLIGGIAGFYYFSTARLIPDMHFARALEIEKGLSTGNAVVIDAAIVELEKAATASIDTYSRALAQANITKLKMTIQNLDVAGATQLADRAVNAGKKAVDINPHDTRNTNNLGTIYTTIIPISEGADRFAIENFNQSIIREPNHPENHLALGKAYLVQSEQLTQKIAEQAQREPSVSPEAQLKASNELQVQSTEALKKASESLQKAIDLKADYPHPYFYKAVAAIGQGDKTNALQLLDKSQSLNYDLIATQTADQELFYLIGLAYNALGQDLKAESSFVLAIKTGINPTLLSLSKWELAALSEKRGDYKQATTFIEELLVNDPANTALLQKREQLKQLQK